MNAQSTLGLRYKALDLSAFSMKIMAIFRADTEFYQYRYIKHKGLT